MKQLIKEMLEDALIFELLDAMMAEEYPSTFDMNHFKSLRKFSERVKYCEEHLKRISSGSSRIVYMVDNTKVLKLAKNEKGIAQCETEIQYGNDYYFEGILAKTLDAGPNDLWVEMELARKVKTSDFKRLIGVNFSDFERFIRNRYWENKGRNRFNYAMDSNEIEKLENNDFVSRVYEFADSTNSVGDLGKLNTYGIVMRDGKETIVIIDFGLTGAVYDTYYNRRAV